MIVTLDDHNDNSGKTRLIKVIIMTMVMVTMMVMIAMKMVMTI